MKEDPEYRKISKRFLVNPEEFKRAFAKAWFKLTHRDIGPRERYIGKEAPAETLIWQDPVPQVKHKLISNRDISSLKKSILATGLSVSELVRVAWASAASFRGTDRRGGANGARLRLLPQREWPVNNPDELTEVLPVLEKIQLEFNSTKKDGTKVSFADVIVLAGNAGIEEAARKAGFRINIPFFPGRSDASQEQTDVHSFSFLEPKADGFRNFYGEDNFLSPAEALIDRANMLTLTVPEVTVLVGGLRVLGGNSVGVDHGIFTSRKGELTNDFFINLLDMSTKWQKSSIEGIYEGVDRKTGGLKWTATPVDLIFGSHSELRAIAEVYGAQDGKEKFVNDFIKAWTKVMNLDRFKLK